MVNNKVKAAFVAVVMIGVTAVLAFNTPDEEHAQTLYWFEVDESSGQITNTYIGNQPDPDCNEPSADVLCSAGLAEDDVDLSDPNNPQPQISDPSQADEQRYRFQ